MVTMSWMGYDKFRPLGKRETGSQAGLGMWVDSCARPSKASPKRP